MADEVGETIPQKITAFAENHPQLLLAIVVVLVIVILFMYLNSCGWDLKVASGCKKKSKKCASITNDEENELDELIESIHQKQKRKKC